MARAKGKQLPKKRPGKTETSVQRETRDIAKDIADLQRTLAMSIKKAAELQRVTHTTEKKFEAAEKTLELKKKGANSLRAL